MQCLICEAGSDYFFSKTYTEPPFDHFMRDVGTVDYHKCRNCGFVVSKTHTELDPVRWAKLNSECHHYFENPASEGKGNQPPYAEQAMMLSLLGRNGIINLESMMDYAAGYGTLSRLLQHHFQIHLPIFDRYVHDGESSRYIRDCDVGTYSTVINSAMFEHILSRNDLDEVHRLVDSEGCLILHTVVCETIPRDPNWYYLRPPVHTAFHTNKSMEILMEQWGYRCSIYCPKSKCWVLLKTKNPKIADIIKAINKELQSDWFYFKDGFMDYWKGF